MSKVSGPVSMYYLKPISNDMPLILLFGDHHFSYDNMCECNSCCHEIYSPCFLKKLDRLSTPSRPVDFYVEYFDDTDDTGSFRSPLDKFRSPVFQSCYKKTMKAGSKCPAPNIRWQYSDIRLSKTKNNIEYIFDSIYVFTQFCEAVNRRGYFEGVSLDTWLKISDSIHHRKAHFDREVVERFLEERPDYKERRANIGYHILDFYKKQTGVDVTKLEQMRKIAQLLVSKNLADDIVELIFGFTNTSSNPSLIYKQFVKQDKSRLFANKDFVVDTMRESLISKLSSEHSALKDEVIEHLSAFDIAYNRYRDAGAVLLHVNSTLVDIYTILRMMKRIESPPALCIGYFGNSHVLNLVDILLRTSYYKKEYFVEEHKDNRCLPFDIDLLGDLRERHGSKSKSKKKSHRKIMSSLESR